MSDFLNIIQVAGQFCSVAQLCLTLCDPWTAARQACLSIANNAIQPSHPLLSPLLTSIFSSIRLFSNELVPRIRWPKYWSFSFSIRPSNEYSGLFPLGWTGWISLQSKGLSRLFSNTTVPKHQFFGKFSKFQIIRG